VVIAAMIFAVLLTMNAAGQMVDMRWPQGGFLAQLMWVNPFIVAFNILQEFAFGVKAVERAGGRTGGGGKEVHPGLGAQDPAVAAGAD
jgi:hypothetical protein